jgi:16S rRNA (guanine527-N7)-methyltransferase
VSESALLESLERLAPDFGFSLPSALLPPVAAYLAELERWNASTNLVGRLSEEELSAHALESLLAAALLSPEDRILDIGSGGGFPGIPLAIAGLEMTLLEPRERRAAFLRHVLRAVGGTRAGVRTGRLEDVEPASFTAATVRGVGDLPELVGRGDFLEARGRLLVWTASGERLAGELRPHFTAETRVAIPRSRRREIVLFRKCSTWNNAGTHG